MHFSSHFCSRLKVGVVMRALASHWCGLGFNIWDYAVPRLVLCSPQGKYFPIPIGWAISNQEPVCRACTTIKSLFVCLFISSLFPSFCSFHPYLSLTFVPPSTYLLGGYSMLPWIVGAFHSPKIPVWNFGNSTCRLVERYIPDAQTWPRPPRVWFAPNTTREPK